MPLLHKSLQMVAGKMPKIINPTAHAVLDCALTGSFILAGARFWKRNKRAAISCFVCGGAAAANSLLTDYPGGISRKMSYRDHGRVDVGLAGATAALPKLMGFEQEREARFFAIQALAETALVGMTDFEYYEHSDWDRRQRRSKDGVA